MDVVVVVRTYKDYDGDLPVGDIIVAGPWSAEVFSDGVKVADAVAYVALLNAKYENVIPVDGRLELVVLDTEDFRTPWNIKKIVWDFGVYAEEEVMKAVKE